MEVSTIIKVITAIYLIQIMFAHSMPPKILPEYEISELINCRIPDDNPKNGFKTLTIYRAVVQEAHRDKGIRFTIYFNDDATTNQKTMTEMRYLSRSTHPYVKAIYSYDLAIGIQERIGDCSRRSSNASKRPLEIVELHAIADFLIQYFAKNGHAEKKGKLF